MKIFTKLLVLSGMLVGCNAFEYSPDQTFDRNSPTNLNKTAIAKLMAAKPQNDTLRFILSGDTQRSYKEIPGFIKKVNELGNIDFVLLAGDITEFGSFHEMEAYAERMKTIQVPLITIIGNHDLTGRGRETYKRMFGALNFSFVYKGTKFICHDTNSREYRYDGRVPDLDWLSQQLQPDDKVQGYVAVGHVPPLSEDFDQKLTERYKAQFEKTPGFLAALYGHTHTYLTAAPKDTFQYVVTGSIESKEFIVVTIINNKLTHERVFY